MRMSSSAGWIFAKGLAGTLLKQGRGIVLEAEQFHSRRSNKCIAGIRRVHTVDA